MSGVRGALPRSGACDLTEEAATDALMKDESDPANVIIHYAGPKGGPGYAGILAIAAIVDRQGDERQSRLLTDGRFSGGSHGFALGIFRRNSSRRPIALVQDGGIEVTIDSIIWSRRSTPRLRRRAERRRRSWRDLRRFAIRKAYYTRMPKTESPLHPKGP